MRIAKRFLVESEELAEGVKGKMSLRVFLLINYRRRKGLFVSLALEDFLLYCACRDEAIDETWERFNNTNTLWICEQTYILSFAHRATRELKLVGRQLDSNLYTN